MPILQYKKNPKILLVRMNMENAQLKHAVTHVEQQSKAYLATWLLRCSSLGQMASVPCEQCATVRSIIPDTELPFCALPLVCLGRIPFSARALEHFFDGVR